MKLTALCFVTFFTFTFNLAHAYPMQASQFKLTNNQGLSGAAREIAGMQNEVRTLKYRHSNSNMFSTIKMPGIAKYGSITLYGVQLRPESLAKLEDQIKMNTISRTTYNIDLLNNDNQITMTWELNNAWPTKIEGVDRVSGYIGKMELAHEQLIMVDR